MWWPDLLYLHILLSIQSSSVAEFVYCSDQKAGPERGVPSHQLSLGQLDFYFFYFPPALKSASHTLPVDLKKWQIWDWLDKVRNDKTLLELLQRSRDFLFWELKRRQRFSAQLVANDFDYITRFPTMQTFQVAGLLSSGWGCWTLHVLTVCSVRWRGESRGREGARRGLVEGRCGQIRVLWHRWCAPVLKLLLWEFEHGEIGVRDVVNLSCI